MGWFSSIAGGIVGFFIGGPVGAVIGAGIGATKVGEKIVSAVVDVVTKPFLEMFGIGQVPTVNDEAQRQQGVLIQRIGGNSNVPVIYGFRAVAGNVVYAETGPESSTPANKYLWVAYVFCEGPVEGLRTLAIDDNELPERFIQDLNAGYVVNINGIPQGQPGWKYNGRVQMEWFHGILFNGLGTVFGQPEENPVGKYAREDTFKDAPGFTDRYTFNGLATLLVRYEMKEVSSNEEAENNPFGGSIPTIRAGIMGRRVIDVATRTYTNGVFDPVKSAQANTVVDEYWATSIIADSLGINSYDVAYNFGNYTTNPASCLLDYLRNPRYGKGLFAFDIDITSWKNAANKCNQHVNYYSGARGPILTMNYVVDTGQTLLTNTKAMLSNFRAYMPYVQGTYKLKIEDAGNETDITSSVASVVATAVPGHLDRSAYDPATFGNVYEIVGDVTYSAIDKSAKYNQVVVTYIDPDQKWSNQQEVWPPTERERFEYFKQDNYRENKGEFTYAAITNKIMARDMARLILLKSRFQESCMVRLSSEAMELEPGDIIRIRSHILDFDDVAWRVVSTRLNADFTVEVGCVRNPATIYPYITYDAPDVLRPPYIPRGNEIYIPGVNNPLMGIFPPSYAPMPANWTGTLPPDQEYPVNLPPSDPTDVGTGLAPGGGGVGGGTGAVSGGTPVVNPPIAQPVIIKTTDDIIIVTGNKLQGNTWTVTFDKSKIQNYAGLKLWYAPQLTDVDRVFALPDVSSGSTSFTFDVTTPSINIGVIARVKYNDGDLSTAAARFTLVPGGSTASTNKVGTFNFSNLNVQPAPTFNADAPIELDGPISNSPVTVPFSATLRIREPVVRTGIIGSVGIKAIHIWYRRNPIVGTDTGYFKAPVVPVNNTQAYETFTATLNNLFGTTNSSWDFVVQWEFQGGVMGNKQLRFRAFLTGDNTNVFASVPQLVDATPVPLRIPVSVANNTSFLSVFAITRSRVGIEGAALTDGMRIFFRNPERSQILNWAGVSVQIARLVERNPVVYTTYERLGGTINTGTDDYFVDILGVPSFAQSGRYNIIITLSYYDTDGTIKFSTFSRKWTGIFDGTVNTNQLSTLVEDVASPGLTLQLTSDVGVVFGPAANKLHLLPNNVEAWSLVLPRDNPNASVIKVPTFRVNFTVPTNITFNRIRVYRRYIQNPAGLDSNRTGGNWEWSDITQTQTNLRYPAQSDVFYRSPSTPLDQGILYNSVTSTRPQIFLRLYTGSGQGVRSDIVIWVNFGLVLPFRENRWFEVWSPRLDFLESRDIIDTSLPGWHWLRDQLNAADQQPSTEVAPIVGYVRGPNTVPFTLVEGVIR